jgi:PAS domain S-box-containing protein
MVSGLALFIGLFNNLALLIILVAVYGFLRDRLRKIGWLRRQLILGVMFSLFVLGCMQVKIPVFEGVLVDQRNAIVVMAGAFGGPIAAVIATVAGSVYRVILGGKGIYGGLLGLSLACIGGSLAYAERGAIDKSWKAAIASVAAAIFVLPGFLPIGSLRDGWELLKASAIPYGSAISIGIFVGSLLLANEERRYDAQSALRESEGKYRELFESLIDLTYRTDEEGVITIASPSSESILGFRPDEIVGRRISELHMDGSRFAELSDMIRRGETIENYQTRMSRKDGRVIAVSTNARAILDSSGRFRGVEGMLRDISPLKQAEDGLKAAIAERETLLMELYHRTNNNMQIISSFLKLQADALGDPKVDALAQSVASRIHAMSLVYEKLYRSKNLSRINVREYVEELVPLVEAYGGAPEGKVRVELDIEDIDFVIDSAVPLGLVVNEIVGNSFKYAFPGDRKGVVRIALHRLDSASIALEIADDGVGLPPGFDPYSTPSFGISTMLSIARLQMRGSVEIRNEAGLSYRITMRDRLYAERV